MFFFSLNLNISFRICNLLTLANYTGPERERAFISLSSLLIFLFLSPCDLRASKWLSDCLISQCAEKSAPSGARTRILGLAVDCSSHSATPPKKKIFIRKDFIQLKKEVFMQFLFETY